MGYALLIKTADGRKWVATRGRRLTNDPDRAMYYPHPSTVYRAIDGFEQKTRYTLGPCEFYLVKIKHVRDYWSGVHAWPKPVHMEVKQ